MWSLLSEFPGSQGDLLSVMRGHIVQTVLCCFVGALAWESAEDGEARSGLRSGEDSKEVVSGPGLEGWAGFQMGKQHSGSRNNVVKA